MIENKIREILRGTLIPVPLESWSQVTDLTIAILNREQVSSEDQPKYLEILIEEWSINGTLSPVLEEIVTQAILQTDTEIGSILSNKYFSLHTYLSGQPFISFKSASITLSHLRLIYHCATAEKMSAAKITSILCSVDSRLEIVRWQDSQYILKQLGIMPTLTISDLEPVYIEDLQSSENHFADASMLEACDMVGEIADSLHFAGNLGLYLRSLIAEETIHKPYLQILHFQCMISSFYDHNLTNAYEFAPRGLGANWIFDKWELPTGNPILNNAKAVDILNSSWANSRKQQEYPTAKVLTDILSRMDQMGFAACNELASWLRKWLVRYIELNKIDVNPVLVNYDPLLDSKLLQKIASSPTQTYGILEQRFLDVVSAALHKDSNWIARGLGDSVNTNNLSRSKLGDVDFQDSITSSITAYEAHGGRLTEIYYQGHLKTLERSMEKRALELEKINPLENWQVKIVFVAFGFNLDQQVASSLVKGVQVSIEFKTFEEILSTLMSDDETFESIFMTHFVEPINKRSTPQLVRDKIVELLSVS
jgi:hypothetical protein